MHTNLEESAITQLLQVLWRSRGALGNAGLGDDIAIGMSVPPTVVYEHNFPKGMFFAGHDGLLSRRVGKDTDSKTLFHIFTEPNAPPRRRAAAKRSTGGGGGGGEGSPTHNNNNSKAAAAHHSNNSSRLDNIVAVYTEKSPDGDRYTATYFTEGTLESFLLGGVHTDESRPSSFSSGGGGGSSTHNPPPSKNGILQKFHEPIGKHNEVIQVLWTPHMCIAEKLRSRVALHDVSKTPFERAATVEAPASSCTRAYVAPEIANKLRQQCETLAEQLYVTERRLIQQMTLYFKVDAFGHLWFLWSPYLRFATHSSSGGGGGNKNSSHGGHLSDATSMLRHSAPALPSFVVPSEVAGTTTASKKSHGPSSPSGGVHQHRIVSNTTFATYDDETVLKVPLPVLPSRCLSTPCTGSSFVAPTKSRLCPKMTWLQQKPSSSGGAGGGGGLSLTATFNRSEHFEQIRQQLLTSSNNNNNSPYRSQHLSRGGGGGPAMEGSANVGLANVSAKREPSMLHSVATPLASRVASPMMFHGSSLSMDVSPVQKSRNSASLRGGGGGLVPNFTMQDLKDLRQARDERQSWLRLADHGGGLDVSDASNATAYRSVIDVLRRNRPASMARDGGDSSAASLETSRSQLHTPTSPSIHNAIRELSPSRVQAQETLTSKQCEGDLQDEIYLLRQLLRRPIPRGVRATLKSIQHLEDAKASMEICGQFVANVRDAAAMHFTEAVEIPSKGIPLPPFAFSVPMPLLDAQDVAAAVIKLCSDTFEMQQVPIGEAIAISRANGRFVPYDLCSMHLDPCFHQEAPPSLSRPASSPPRATATVVATTATATTTHQLPSSASESSRNNNNTNSENGKETQKEGGRPPTAPPQQQQQQQQEEENQNVVDVNGGQEEGEGTSLLQERQEEVEGNRNDDVPAQQREEGNPPAEEAASTDPHVVADDEGGAPSEPTPAPSSSAAEMNEPKASKEDGEGNNNNNNNMNNMNNAEIQQQQQQQHHSTSKEDREDILNNGSVSPPTTATVEDDRRRIAPVCFVMRTPATLTSFMSRLSPFLVVTLRNLHAMIEGSLR